MQIPPHLSARQAPSVATVTAAVSLLADRDPRVVELCERQLWAWGRAAIPGLRQVASGADPWLAGRARVLCRNLELRDWSVALIRLAGALGSHNSPAHDTLALAVGSLRIASFDRQVPMVADEALEQLACLGEGLRGGRLGSSAVASAHALRDWLAGEHGYRMAPGLDVTGLHLDRILASRVAGPAGLGLVYLLVARRAGLRARAVLLPDRVLVRVQGSRAALVDPCDGGHVLTKLACTQALRARGCRGGIRRWLEDCADAQLLVRLLRDMQRCYAFQEDVPALAVLRRVEAAFASQALRSIPAH